VEKAVKQASHGATKSSAPTMKRERRSPDVHIVMRPPRESANEFALPSKQKLIDPIRRGLAVLDAFQAGDQWLGNQEIAARTSIPRATVSRLIGTLATLGYLRYSTRVRRYRLAATVLGLGYSAIADSDIVSVARPRMQQLADETGTFVSLVGRDGLDVILLETCHSTSTMVTLGLSAGAHMPVAASPLGWALLSGLPASERSYLLNHARRYHRSQWPTLSQRIAESVQQVTKRGYCIWLNELGPNIAAVAAPLNVPNRPPMALGCAGPKGMLTKARLIEKVGPSLATLVAQLQKDALQFSEPEV
jgi:DNA-binding IclR family transcriptional regulator